jgi:hypothetical protein
MQPGAWVKKNCPNLPLIESQAKLGEVAKTKLTMLAY